jgi:hypothetical protein
LKKNFENLFLGAGAAGGAFAAREVRPAEGPQFEAAPLRVSPHPQAKGHLGDAQHTREHNPPAAENNRDSDQPADRQRPRGPPVRADRARDQPPGPGLAQRLGQRRRHGGHRLRQQHLQHPQVPVGQRRRHHRRAVHLRRHRPQPQVHVGQEEQRFPAAARDPRDGVQRRGRRRQRRPDERQQERGEQAARRVRSKGQGQLQHRGGGGGDVRPEGPVSGGEGLRGAQLAVREDERRKRRRQDQDQHESSQDVQQSHVQSQIGHQAERRQVQEDKQSEVEEPGGAERQTEKLGRTGEQTDRDHAGTQPELCLIQDQCFLFVVLFGVSFCHSVHAGVTLCLNSTQISPLLL